MTEEWAEWVRYNIHIVGINQDNEVAINKMLRWIRKHKVIRPSKDSITRFKPYRIIYEDELPSA